MAEQQTNRWKWVGIFVGTGLAGGGVALLVTALMVLSSTRAQLAGYATEFLTQDEKIAHNIDVTLAAANASRDTACSDADLNLLRSLLFNSPYLKDVGRVDGDALVCSAVAGRLANPIASQRGAETTYKGRKIYYDVDLQIVKGHHAEVVADGRTNVVVNPDVFADFSRLPMLFTGAIVDPETKSVLRMYSSSDKPMPINLMLTDEPVRKNGFYYYPMCSKTRPDCVLTALPMSEVWLSHYELMLDTFSAGVAIGLAFAAVFFVASRRQRSLANQLRRAIRLQRLGVVYQPIVDLSTGAIIGCEALARWRDEDGHVVRPEVFVGLAEEHGFIGEITMFMAERVLTEMEGLLRSRPKFCITINLSAKDLEDESFLPRLDALMKRTKMPASSLGLELTERSTADKHVAMRVIHSLRERGHTVCIDDFGTGYSSLAYLHELSVDVLKIDRAFTNTIGTESVTASIVPQILSMAEALKLKAVVEGVETLDQAEYLRSFPGEIKVQGWLYGKPMHAPELFLLLDDYKPSVDVDTSAESTLAV